MGLNIVCSLRAGEVVFCIIMHSLCATNAILNVLLFSVLISKIYPTLGYLSLNIQRNQQLWIRESVYRFWLLTFFFKDQKEKSNLNISNGNGLEFSSESTTDVSKIKPMLINLMHWKGVRKLENNSLAEHMYLFWLSTLISKFIISSFLYFFHFDWL